MSGIFWRKVVNDVRSCTLYLKTNKSSKSFNIFNEVALFDREICKTSRDVTQMFQSNQKAPPSCHPDSVKRASPIQTNQNVPPFTCQFDLNASGELSTVT